MASTTITRTPNRCTDDGLQWWTTNVYETRLGLDDDYFAGYALEPGTQADFTAASIEVDFSQTELWTDSATFQCSLYNSQDLDNSHLIGSQSFSLTNYEGTPVRHKFNFPNVSASGTGLYFKIVHTSGGGYWYVTHPTASATYSVPALSVGVTPSSVAVGNSVTLSFTNRFTQTLSVVLKYGSTQLTSFSVSADTRVVNTSNGWFTTAGVTGNSMRVDVNVSDGTGRTASASFTLTRSGLSVGVSPSSVNLGSSVTLSFSGRYGNSVTVQFKYGTQLLESKTATSDSLSITPPLSWFTAAGTTGSMRVDVLATDSTGRTASANFTLVMPGLTVSASPASLYTGNAVTIALGNRLEQSVTLVLRYQQTELYRTTMNAYSASITAQESWFTTASVSGNTMQVTAAVSDGLGRTASTTFTVNKPTGSTATPTEPVNVTKDGEQQITFKWTYSGNGTQTKAQLQWKTSSGDWQSLGTVNGAGTSYTAAAYKFPQGAISWRVRVTNSFGIVGSWSTASFNVSYAALSVSASPASVYVDNPVTLSFTNRIGRALSVVIKYNDTVLKTLSASSDSVQITPTSDWFSTASVTASSMQVTVSVSDNLGRSATARFTVREPQASTATPTEPVSVSKNGATAIAFKWTYAGDGTQTKAELQWKTSSGDWQSLGTVNGAGTSYTAPAYKFPLGSVNWRVRVTNSFGIVGNWSGSASFTVSYAALSVSASPASVYLNNQGTLSFTNRLGRTLLLEFRANGQVLQPAWEVVADSVSFRVTSDWFSTAGVSGSSMQVTAAISDALGRTASTTFTAINPQGSTATPTAPKSTTVDGASQINFAWNVSSDWGAQVKAELQWSTDGVVWTDLTTVSGSDQTWTAPAVEFPAGTIYWRARVTNVWGILGDWSSPVNFTVNYAAVSQVVQINSQTSGIFARGAVKTFAARFEASGPVYSPFTFQTATFKWRAGTSGDWTEVTMTSSDNGVTVSATIPGGTFPAGVMQWVIEATDNTGRTTSTPEYTLTAATSAVDVTPIRPVNTVETNNSDIRFELSFVSLDGSLPQAAEWRWSSDGVEWHSEALPELDIRDGVLAFTVPAGTFQAGTISWQARAENSADTWGDWSGVVSFKALGAPVVAAVAGNGKPFLTISWQTPAQGEYGQQAYKIEVDGKLYGPYFGADVRSYTLREPLARGSHTIRVAAQNRFGLWSEWTEAQVSVLNIQGSVSFFPAAMAEGPFAHIVMIYAHPAPTITQQPQDYRAETGNAVFSFKSRGFASGTKYQPRGSGTAVSWFFRTGPGAEWQEYHGPFDGAKATPAASQEIDGYQYRVMLDTDTGRIYSEPATFHYGTPAGPASELKEGTWRSDTGYFMIYRDGVLIGTTYENEFYDYAAIGTHTYRVIQVIRLGYYVEGTPLPDYETITVKVDAPTIITLDGKKALSLTLSEDARRVQNIQRAREVAYTQYEGATFPEAEIGEHETLSISGDCAWTWEQQADADAFEALLGTPVIYKTPGGEMVVGVLDGFTQKDAHFYRTARFTIQQMDWRDYRDEP